MDFCKLVTLKARPAFCETERRGWGWGRWPFEKDDGDDDADDEHHSEDRPHHPQHLRRIHTASHTAVLHHYRVRVRAGGENALQEQTTTMSHIEEIMQRGGAKACSWIRINLQFSRTDIKIIVKFCMIIIFTSIWFCHVVHA